MSNRTSSLERKKMSKESAVVVKREVDDSALFKVPQMPSTSVVVTSAEAQRTLSNWRITFLPSMEKRFDIQTHPPFSLAGKRPQDPPNCAPWKTAVIKSVSEDGRRFTTVSGSMYYIREGGINKRELIQDGFSLDFVERFVDRFPPDWADWLWEAYRKKKDELANRIVPSRGGPIVTHPNSDGENEASASTSRLKKNHSMADVTNHSLVPLDQSRFSTRGSQIVNRPPRSTAIQGSVTMRQAVRCQTVNMEPISGRTLRSDHSLPMQPPRLSIENGGSQFVKPKKRTVAYKTSSSDDDSGDDLFTRTLRHIDYDQMAKPRRPGAKMSRMEVGGGDDSDEETRILEEIDSKERKMQRNIKKAVKTLEELGKARVRLTEKRERRRQRTWNEVQMARRDEEFDRQQETLEVRRRHQQQRKSHKAAPPTTKKKKSIEMINLVTSGEDSSEDDSYKSEESEDEKSGSTETEVTDDGGEWEETPRKKKIAKKTKRSSGKRKKTMARRSNGSRKGDDEEESEESEEEEDLEQTVEPVVKKPRKQKEKKPTWHQGDLDRLKLAMEAIKVRSDEDWEKVSSALGSQFPAADCREMAVKKLKWKPPVEEPKEKAEIVVTARKGTQAYQIQADQQTRKFMMGGRAEEEDAFRNEAMGEEAEEFEMPNVAEFDPDDSLLEVLKSPTVTAGAGRKGANRRQYIAAPLAVFDETPPRRSAKRSSAISLDESGSLDRENRQRYLHHLMQHNKSRLNNTTRMNNSTMNMTEVDCSRAVDKVGKKFDRIQKATKQMTKTKKQEDFDEKDEEEEEGEGEK